MTKLAFVLPEDKNVHEYCLGCHSQEVVRFIRGQRTYYRCNACRHEFTRTLVIDPGIVWWMDERTLEYWHESVGAFLCTSNGHILLFERSIYPFALTIPAGHLDLGEGPRDAVLREIKEEVGIGLASGAVHLFSEEDVVGDSCRRGADCHRWHLYTASVDDDECQAVCLNDEGMKPVWLTTDEASTKQLTFATRYFLEKYGPKLLT